MPAQCAKLSLGCLEVLVGFGGGAGQAGPKVGPHRPGRSHTCTAAHALAVAAVEKWQE